MPRGIFRLKQVYEEQLSGEWSTKGDVFLSPSPFNAAHPFGYFGGGGSPGPAISTVGRIDYSNDTATATEKGPLSSARYDLAATGNGPFGYFGGGYSELSTVDRIDYSNDTATASTRGPLSLARWYLGATGNSFFGYFGGGNGGSISTVDRVDYSNDTATAVAKGPLSSSRYGNATGNSSFGYFGGGYNGSSWESTVDRIDYSNDTATASPKGPLSLGKTSTGATGNQNFGYFGGGWAGVRLSTIDRIDYSSDTGTTPSKGPLSSARYGVQATGNADFGYFAGGRTPSLASTVDRIDYSNDTATAAVKGPLSAVKVYGGATGNADSGYFGGGHDGSSPGYLSSVDRIDYSNDTATASAKGSLSITRHHAAACSSRANAMLLENIVNYAAGTLATPNTGYFGGGYPGSASNVDRIDYDNDTATAVAKGPLSNTSPGASATGNTSFGYFGGRHPAKSTVDRIDYLNDTATAMVRGPLSAARRYTGSTGTSSFGYFGGGYTPSAYVSTIDRIDYANDSETAVAKGPLSVAKQFLAATGNSDFGYFGGGTPGPKSTVDRVDYSNDTATAVSKGPLSVARTSLGATGNASFGYFAGGWVPGYRTTIDRIDYSNDTATATVKGPLSSDRSNLAATSARANGFVPIGPSLVVNSTIQVLPSTWEILMFTTGNKGSSGGQGNSTEFGNTGSSTWESITASSTGADDRTSFNDGAGLYNAFFTKTGITQIALVDGTGSLSDPTSNTNYLIYDLVGSGTGNETIYEILYRLDQYNLNNSSWAANDTLFGTDSCTDFTAGTAKSGTLSSQGGSWEANNANPSGSKQLSEFHIWGVNRDSDNDTQVLCACAANLQTGKADSWRGSNPDETFWSYWGNDWHSNTQSQTISRGKQTDPGVVTGETAVGVYLIAK